MPATREDTPVTNKVTAELFILLLKNIPPIGHLFYDDMLELVATLACVVSSGRQGL
ncbi:MAG: hypothetical protein K0Q59_5737 [Paenibacillus sp.]|nr:hypothetical protein [Paenibacillus sp.]